MRTEKGISYLSFPIHFMANCKTIYVYYLKKKKSYNSLKKYVTKNYIWMEQNKNTKFMWKILQCIGKKKKFTE